MILDKLQSEYAFNIVSAPWETDTQKLEAQYKQVGEDAVDQQGEEDAPSGEDEGLFDEGGDTPNESNPFDYRHYLDGLPQAPKSIPATSTPILAASRPPVALKPATSRPSIGATRQAPASRPRPQKKAQPSVPPPQVRLERRAAEKRPSPAYEEEEGPAANNADDSDGGLIIDMGEGYQPPPKKRAVNLGLRQPISLRAAASASPNPGFSPAPPEAGSGYEEDDEEDDEEMAEQVEEQDEDPDQEADVTELALGSSAAVDDVDINTVSRRQSGWDAEATAALEAEMMRALEADEEEEAVVQAPAQESEEESEEE